VSIDDLARYERALRVAKAEGKTGTYLTVEAITDLLRMARSNTGAASRVADSDDAADVDIERDRAIASTEGFYPHFTPARVMALLDALADARAERDRLRAFADAVLAEVDAPGSSGIYGAVVRRLAAEHGIET
jgi:hypothetical protein